MKRYGPNRTPRRAVHVARHRTRIPGDVPGVVRVAVRVRPAVLVPDGEVRHVLDEVAAQRGVGHEQVGGADQVHFLVQPPPQRLVVRQGGDVVRIVRVPERGARLVGALDGVAERVVVHAGPLARHRAAEGPEDHAGRGTAVRHHPDAAVGSAEAAERAVDPVGVDRRQVQVAPRPRVAHADVPVGVPPAHQEVAVDRGGDPRGAGLAAQPAPGAGVAERAAVQVPGGVAQAGAHRIGLPVTRVARAELLPSRVVGRHLHDGGARQREGRVRRRRVPVRDDGVGPEPLDVVVGAVVQGSVDLGEGARLLLLVDQVVVGRVAEAAGPALVLAAEIRAAGIEDVGGPRRRRPDRERAGVPQARPAGAVAADVRAQAVERPRAILHLQLLPADPLRGEDGAGVADPAAPDAGDRGIAAAVEVVVRDVELEAPEVAARHEVGDAADRVGAVRRGGSLFHHLEPADRDGRDRVDVDEASPDQARGHRHVAPPVDQHERSRGAQAAQVDVGHVLGEGRRLVGVVPTVPLADHAVADVQVAEQVDELSGSLLLQRLAADDGHRVRHVDGRRLDGGAGHRHGDLLEEPAERQVGVDGGRQPRGQLHFPLRPLEAGQAETDDVAAGRERREGIAAVTVGEGHPRAGQRGARRFHGDAGEHAARVVRHRARNPAVLRDGGDRRREQAYGDQCGSHRHLHSRRTVEPSRTPG